MFAEAWNYTALVMSTTRTDLTLLMPDVPVLDLANRRLAVHPKNFFDGSLATTSLLSSTGRVVGRAQAMWTGSEDDSGTVLSDATCGTNFITS